MTFSPIFCASIAQASPVGPAPMTSTSVLASGRDLALVLGRVSSSTAARKSGMGLTAGVGRGDEGSTQPGNRDSSMGNCRRAYGWKRDQEAAFAPFQAKRHCSTL